MKKAEKIYVGSTAYDLKDLRPEIIRFLRQECHLTPINFESTDFPIDTKLHSHDVCIENVRNSDAYLLIIDERFGGVYSGKKYPLYRQNDGILLSVTWAEAKFAFDNKIPVYTYIRNSVWDERNIYKKQSCFVKKKYKPAFVKDIRTFDFIDFIVHQPKNNWRYTFDNVVDLKEKIQCTLPIYENPIEGYFKCILTKIRKDDFLSLSPAKIGAEKIYIPFTLSEDKTINSPVKTHDLIKQLHQFKPRNRIPADHVLDDLIRNQKSAVILGIPGSGKSKLVRHWSGTTVKHIQKSSSSPFPILIPAIRLIHSINNCHEGGEEGFIQILSSSLNRSQKDATKIFSRIKKGPSILFVDGLDEVPDGNIGIYGREYLEEWLKDLQQTFKIKRLVIIVTCRKANYYRPFQSFQHFLIDEFSQDQTGLFIQRWFGKEKGVQLRLREQLRQNDLLMKLSKNPLLLKLICILFSRSSEPFLSLKRMGICKESVLWLLETWEQQHAIPKRNQVDIRIKMKILGSIAFEMMNESERESSLEKIYNNIYNHRPVGCTTEPQLILNELVTSGLVIPTREENYGFALPTFLEFFAAFHLHEQKDWMSKIGIYAKNKNWYGAFSLLAQNNEEATDIVMSLLSVDPILAYDSQKEWKIDGATQLKLMKALVDTLEKLEKHRRWSATEIIMRRLEVMPSPDEAATIYRNLPEEAFYLIDWWAKRLAESDSVLARNVFIQSLDQSGPIKKQISLRYLGNSTGIEAHELEKIRQMILSSIPTVQWECIHALANVSNSDSCELLRSIVNDRAYHRLVRAEAVRALGDLGNNEDLSILQKMQEGENEWVIEFFLESSILELSSRLKVPVIHKKTKTTRWDGIFQSKISPNWNVNTVEPGDNPKWVLHVIETNFNNWDTRWNELEFLHYAIATCKIKTLYAEGGEGDIDLKSLRPLASISKRIRVALEYFKDGKLHPEEFLQIASDYPFSLRGLDSREVYDIVSEKLRKGDDSEIDSEMRICSMLKNILYASSKKLNTPVIIITAPGGIRGGVEEKLHQKIGESGLSYAKIRPEYGMQCWPLPKWDERIFGS